MNRTVFGALGVAFLVAIVIAAYTGVTPSYSGATYYTASFGRVGQGLDERSDVKIRGVDVGGVDSVSLGADGRAVVRIRLDRGVRLPETSAVTIEPVSIFGPKDVTVDLGSGEGKGPYLRDGGRIGKTTDPQELSDVAAPTYELVSAIDAQELATVLRTFAAGLRGQGPALRRTVDNGAALIGMAYSNKREIQQLLADVRGLAATLENRGGTLTGLARDANTLSGTLNERPDKVGQLLDGASTLAVRAGDSINRNGTKTGQLIDGASRTIGVMYGERANIPVLVEALSGFFGGLSDIIQVPGPKGTLLARVDGYLPLDICRIIVDLCPAPDAPAKPSSPTLPILPEPPR